MAYLEAIEITSPIEIGFQSVTSPTTLSQTLNEAIELGSDFGEWFEFGDASMGLPFAIFYPGFEYANSGLLLSDQSVNAPVVKIFNQGVGYSIVCTYPLVGDTGVELKLNEVIFPPEPALPARGLLFSAGVVSDHSHSGSGMLQWATLGSIPAVKMGLVSGALEGWIYDGLFKIVVSTWLTDNWDIYLEAVNAFTGGRPTSYILYHAHGYRANAYGVYKQLMELRTGLADIATYDMPAYVWAQNTAGTYKTGKVPLYFRR